MKIRVAEINVEIHNRFPYLERLCRDYIADFERPDIVVSITEEEIAHERATAKSPCTFSDGYLESLCTYRAIAEELPRFNAFVFHAAVISYGGEAFAFSAPSGTGKTTHIRLWQKVFGDAVSVLNGDKPIIRIKDGVPIAYGTPWCGKEGMQENAAAPLSALIFIKRAPENSISPLSDSEYLSRVFYQVYVPKNSENRVRFLDLLHIMATSVPTFLLGCNMEDDAPQIALNGILSHKNRR